MLKLQDPVSVNIMSQAIPVAYPSRYDEVSQDIERVNSDCAT